MERVGLIVPNDCIARVIGKAGAGLRAIRESSGCRVNVVQESNNGASGEAANIGSAPAGGTGVADGTATASCRVDLSGLPDQILAGAAVLVSKAFSSEPSSVLTVMIPAERAGAVVGKGGEHLKRIREECRVRVTLERETMADPTSNQPERAVTLHGDTLQLAQALRLVLSATAGSAVGIVPAVAFTSAASLAAAAQLRAPGLAIGAAAAAAPGLAAGALGGLLSGQGGVALSSVRLASANPEEIQIHMVVPDRLAGSILGKGGEKVKQVASTSNAKVCMTTRDGTECRRVVIIGTYAEVAHAQNLIYDALLEAARSNSQDVTEVSVIFLIRKEAAGVVIGKQGATMKQMREQTTARIHLAREEIENQRPCSIAGPLQEVLQAEKLIADLVGQVPVEPPVPSNGGAMSGGLLGMGLQSFLPVMQGKDFNAAFGLSLGKRRPDDPEATTKLLVPAQAAGAVIGRQGTGLKQLRETCGVQVEMMQQAQAPQWPTDRVVIVRGTLQCRQAATEVLLRTIATGRDFATDACNLKMLVPASQVGSVIGKQGNMLRTIREQCGVNAQVERDDVAGERLVTATGSLLQVLTAASAIILILENASHANGNGSCSSTSAASGGEAAPSSGAPPTQQQQQLQQQQNQQQHQQQHQPQQAMQTYADAADSVTVSMPQALPSHNAAPPQAAVPVTQAGMSAQAPPIAAAMPATATPGWY